MIVNPVLETSDVPETMPDPDNDDEGCLSVPGESFPTGRADWARVTGLDADGTPITLEGTGLFARMLQHETGHLDGLPVPRPAGRPACPQRQAGGEVARLGCARAVVDARRGPGSVRPLAWSICPRSGTRVSLRYRLPAGSVPPLTDVIGHLLETGPHVRVQTKTGAVVEIAPDDVVAVRALTARRCGRRRSARPSTPPRWRGRASSSSGWTAGCCAAAGGHTHRANSAVPLGVRGRHWCGARDRRLVPRAA